MVVMMRFSHIFYSRLISGEISIKSLVFLYSEILTTIGYLLSSFGVGNV